MSYLPVTNPGLREHPCSANQSTSKRNPVLNTMWDQSSIPKLLVLYAAEKTREDLDKYRFGREKLYFLC